MINVSRLWQALAAAAAVAAAAGCAGSGAESTSVEVAGTAPSTNATISEPAGMYRWDPQGGFHDTTLSGTLAVEGSCVYLDSTDPQDTQIRAYVHLPEPLTDFDPATGAIWVGDYGPMRHGDAVVLVGSEGWQQDWRLPWDVDGKHMFWSRGFDTFNDVDAECLAHTSLWAASVRPHGTDDTNVPRAADLPGLSLFAWDIDLMHTDVGVPDATLVIEPPCVYVDLDATYKPEVSRRRLSLPRPRVRFDADTATLWVGIEEGFRNGDRVEVGGVKRILDALPSAEIEAACPADETLQVVSMRHLHEQ